MRRGRLGRGLAGAILAAGGCTVVSSLGDLTGGGGRDEVDAGRDSSISKGGTAGSAQTAGVAGVAGTGGSPGGAGTTPSAGTAGSGGSGGTTGHPPKCPAAVPQQDTPCAPVGLSCSYAGPCCTEEAACFGVGWRVTPCPDPECPADPPAPGQSCSCQEGLFCPYERCDQGDPDAGIPSVWTLAGCRGSLWMAEDHPCPSGVIYCGGNDVVGVIRETTGADGATEFPGSCERDLCTGGTTDCSCGQDICGDGFRCVEHNGFMVTCMRTSL